MNGGEGSRKPLQDKGSSIHINPPSKLDMNDPPLNLDMNEETCSERGGDPALPSPPERAAGDYASEEWIYDFTAPGEPTRTHVSPPPPERAAGDDVRRTTCLLSSHRRGGSRIPSVSTTNLPRGEIFSDCPDRGRGGPRGEARICSRTDPSFLDASVAPLLPFISRIGG